MSAYFIKIGDPPPTIGGEYEHEVINTIVNKLSDRFIVIGNPSFPTRSSFFYDYDVIILSDFLCDIIEVKRIYPIVKVHEDLLEGLNDFRIPRAFSILENKTKVLASRLKKEPFFWQDLPMIESRIIVGPEQTHIRFSYRAHRANNKVMYLRDAVKYYKEKENLYGPAKGRKKDTDFSRLRDSWINYANKLKPVVRDKHRLGRFYLRRLLHSDRTSPEYLAVDEPPCKVEVHLKEYPFEPMTKENDLQDYLKEMTREMQVLREIRHQYIRCVTGHFRTGCSLVQVSDWFDGIPLEESWEALRDLSLSAKIILMIKVVQGLAFCHSKGVFHRNISGSSILVSEDFDDVRVTGFEFAKNLALSRTVSEEKMKKRDSRLIPPEELMNKGRLNYRLYDIYQVGLLFYRIIENGEWPFEDALDYCTGDGTAREILNHKSEKGNEKIVELILSTMAVRPKDRPDPLQKVDNILQHIMAGTH
jgi:serine/threonine protein kinase